MRSGAVEACPTRMGVVSEATEQIHSNFRTFHEYSSQPYVAAWSHRGTSGDERSTWGDFSTLVLRMTAHAELQRTT